MNMYHTLQIKMEIIVVTSVIYILAKYTKSNQRTKQKSKIKTNPLAFEQCAMNNEHVLYIAN